MRRVKNSFGPPVVSSIPGCSLYTRPDREGVDHVAAPPSPQRRQVSAAFSVAATAREVRHVVLSVGVPVRSFPILSSPFFVFSSRPAGSRVVPSACRVHWPRLSCQQVSVRGSKVTRVSVRGKRACRSRSYEVSFCRADSDTRLPERAPSRLHVSTPRVPFRSIPSRLDGTESERIARRRGGTVPRDVTLPPVPDVTVGRAGRK